MNSSKTNSMTRKMYTHIYELMRCYYKTEIGSSSERMYSERIARYALQFPAAAAAAKTSFKAIY